MSDHKGKQPVRGDGQFNALTNDEPNSAGLVLSERSGAIGVETSSQRITAKPGDENKIAMDVSLSDGNGNSINTNNPLPTFLTANPATEIENYDKAIDIAKDGGTANHDYTTTSEFRGLNVECNSGGLASFELQVETGPATNVFETVMRKFNSVSNPSVIFAHKSPKAIASGVIIRVIKTNLDNQITDLDSLINGTEEV